MVECNHWDQWFSDGFGVRQPLATMVFDGCAPLVRRWNGYVPSLKSKAHNGEIPGLHFNYLKLPWGVGICSRRQDEVFCDFGKVSEPYRLRRWYITIPLSDQWCTTIENHRYQWLSYPKTIGKPLIPMVALNHSIQW